MDQIHTKFKVFTGPLAADKTIGPLGKEIETFVSQGHIAAKSIGVEYLEHTRRLVMTLGYRDDQAGYPVKIHCTRIGKIDTNTDFTKLEQAMGAAAAAARNVLCHELYITEDDEFYMVLMTRE
jgi:hypothetical protein